MSRMPDPRWVSCPECGGAARQEPGGVRCVVGGHAFTFRRILPKTTTGHDWKNRVRMRALDEAFVYPGRGGSIPLNLCIRLEGDRIDDDDD
jgi:hypothetical protein